MVAPETQKIQINIVTPSALFFSDEVEMVTIPGTDGDFGVMRDHVPFVSTLRAGIIEIYQSGNVTERLFVSSGFAETHGETCTILAEEIYNVDSLNKDEIERDLSRLNTDFKNAQTDAEKAILEQKIASAEAKINVLN